MKKTFNIIGYFFIVVIFLFAISEIFVPYQTIHFFGVKPYRVVSDSMSGLIEINDVVIVRKINESDLNEGDIITFITHINDSGVLKQIIVTHYIGSIDTDSNGKTYYQTQTYDNYHHHPEVFDNQWRDSEGTITMIYFEDIQGEVIFTIPWIGYVIAFIQGLFSSPIMVALIGINVVIIISIIYVIKKKPDKLDESIPPTENE